MSLFARLQTIQVPNLAGDHDYPGFGFAPKAVIFFCAGSTAAGYQSSSWLVIGLAVSSTQRGTVAWRRDNNVFAGGFTDFTHAQDQQVLTGPVGEVDTITMGADGFSLHWGTVGTAGMLIEALAIGGDACSAAVGHFDLGVGATTVVTGVGFQPQCVFLLHAGGATWNPGADVDNAQGGFGFGTGSGATEQGALSIQCFSGNNPTSELGGWDDGCVSRHGGPQWISAIQSLDADGFTLASAPAPPVTKEHVYLCLRDDAGTSFKALLDTQKTSTGAKSQTGAGFEPGALVATGGAKSANGLSTDCLPFVGAYDGSSHGVTYGGSLGLQTPNTSSDKRTVDTVLVSHSHPQANTDAEASVQSLDADGYTLDWSTADATARKFVVLCLLTRPAPVRGGGNRWWWWDY